MTKFDRSRFTGVKASDLVDEDSGENSREKKKYFNLNSGKNVFRVLPCHPETKREKKYFYLRKVASWLPFTNREGRGSRRPFLNSRFHSLSVDMDVVEQYIKAATRVIKDSQMTAKQKNELIDELSHYRTGIKPKHTFLMYVKQGEELGLLEIPYSVKKELDNFVIDEETKSGIDPVSDPDEGSEITITKDAENNYTTVLARRTSMISEDDLMWFGDQVPLDELLDDKYNKGTFDIVLKSLKVFDSNHKINAISDESFLEIAEEIRDALPEIPERDDDQGGEEKGGETEDVKQLQDMSKIELKRFISDNDLKIRVSSKMDEEDILLEIEEIFGGKLPELPLSDSDDEEEGETDTPPKAEKAPPKTSARKEREPRQPRQRRERKSRK